MGWLQSALSQNLLAEASQVEANLKNLECALFSPTSWSRSAAKASTAFALHFPSCYLMLHPVVEPWSATWYFQILGSEDKSRKGGALDVDACLS